MPENITTVDGQQQDQDPEYLCPSCDSDHLAADAIQEKTVYLSVSGVQGEIVDERGGHTDFESFRCTHCGHSWDAEHEVVRAVHSMAAAGGVVEKRLTQTEQSVYYQVLDALQALAWEEGNGEEIG